MAFGLFNFLFVLALFAGQGDCFKIPNTAHEDDDVNLKIVHGRVGRTNQIPHQAYVLTRLGNTGKFG